ncbi:MAG: iron-sulfur cluster assembly accessory protein [Elusimicrobia bacterium]|nr:iron-sulfur cluster assembly accessory protein [Elusimicrobiota bacterium]
METVTTFVTLSKSAAEKLREMAAKQAPGSQSLRVFVKSGGCRGFSYGMAFDSPQEGDQFIESEGIKILVDAESAHYLNGATVDFKDEIMGGGFSIENPNATSTCGCGQSFKAKGETGSPKSCC